MAKEVRQGLVIAEGAKAYGVAIAANGSVDEAETLKLRDEMLAAGTSGELFDRGERSTNCARGARFGSARRWAGGAISLANPIARRAGGGCRSAIL